jgi:hypothetical protein
MNRICQVSNVSACYTSHAEIDTGTMLDLFSSRSHEQINHYANVMQNLPRSVIPYSPIAGHVDVEFFCDAVNLFRCHPTEAEHSDLHKTML